MDSGRFLGMQSQQISTTDRCRYNVWNVQISPTIIYFQSNNSVKDKQTAFPNKEGRILKIQTLYTPSKTLYFL